MQSPGQAAQRGITFLGLLVVGVILALLVIVAARVVPTVSEYMAITKAVKKAAREGDTVPAVRAAFDRNAAVDYIDSISGEDLQIGKVDGKIVVHFAYNKEIPLFGPAYLLLKYEGRSDSGHN